MRPFAFALALAISTPAHAIPPGADGAALRSAMIALREARVEDAHRVLEDLRTRHPTDADVLTASGELRLLEGDYRGGARDLEEAIRIGGSNESRALLSEVLGRTRDTTIAFLEARSSDGRFVVRYAPGPDIALVPYALEALEQIATALERDLGYRMPVPVRLEIYPTPSALASVSTLTVDEIERTGTIALCKWDRLMVTSPRALVHGYPWVDTIGHEYVHLVLTRMSRDRAPVWFQEGVAKFLERRYRGEQPAARLDEASLDLLVEAVRGDSLLPFDALHPSIARLPSQEQAALAFAQVATFIESFVSRHGMEALRESIASIAGGEDARTALASAAGTRFGELEQTWRASLGHLSAPPEPPPLPELRFRRGPAPANGIEDAREVRNSAARRFVEIGDLLYDRGRPLAASAEYERAQEIVPSDPFVASRVARAAIDAGDADRAIRAVDRVAPHHVEHAPLFAAAGRAYVMKGNLAAARPALREAIRINPFDPAPHCDLANATEDEHERDRERHACSLLGGRAP
jgi:tetratricopeptide (TPR) repeat protein